MSQKLIDDIDKYANLLMSVGVLKTTRPLIPIEAAELIYRLKEEEEETHEQIAKRLGLGKSYNVKSINNESRDTSTVQDFLRILNLSHKSRKLLGWGRSDSNKIPFMVGAIISKLDSKDDQDMVIQSSLTRGIKKKEANMILNLKKTFPNMPIESCIEKILKIRPIEKTTYITIHTLSKKMMDKLTYDSLKHKCTVPHYIIKLLQEKINSGKIISVRLKGNTMYISADKEADAAIQNNIKKSKLTFSKYLNYILDRDHIE